MDESFAYSKGAWWMDPDGGLHDLPEYDQGGYDHAEYISPGYRDQFADPHEEDFDLVQEERSRLKNEHIQQGWVRLEIDDRGWLEIECIDIKAARRAASEIGFPGGIHLDLGVGYEQKSYQIEPDGVKHFINSGKVGVALGESISDEYRITLTNLDQPGSEFTLIIPAKNEKQARSIAIKQMRDTDPYSRRYKIKYLFGPGEWSQP